MITQDIETAIRADYGSGLTQHQLARKYHLSQSYLNELLAAKRPFGGLTLAKIDRAWPHAVIHLHGDPPQPPPVAQTAHHAANIAHFGITGTFWQIFGGKRLDNGTITAQTTFQQLL